MITIAAIRPRSLANKIFDTPIYIIQRFFASDGSEIKKPVYDEGGRYGSRLLKKGRNEQFERMQSILGAQAAPKQVKTVTISILQSLKHLDLDMSYKKKLASYRIKQLGRSLMPLIVKTEAEVKSSDRVVGRASGNSPATKN